MCCPDIDRDCAGYIEHVDVIDLQYNKAHILQT